MIAAKRVDGVSTGEGVGLRLPVKPRPECTGSRPKPGPYAAKGISGEITLIFMPPRVADVAELATHWLRSIIAVVPVAGSWTLRRWIHNDPLLVHVVIIIMI